MKNTFFRKGWIHWVSLFVLTQLSVVIHAQVLWDEVVWSSNGDIFSARLDGSNFRIILDNPAEILSFPTISPNGQRLSFLSSGNPQQVCVYDASGLTCVDTPGFTYGPAWDSNSQTVYYARNQGDGQIWKIDWGAATPAAELFLDPSVYRTFGLSVAGDGSKMVMVHDPSNWTFNNYLSVYDFAVGSETNIYPSNGLKDFFPDYSPTRDEIVWGQGEPGSQALDVWIINGDGSNPVNLTPNTSGVHNREPRFSPDGDRIYYTTGTFLWVTDRNGAFHDPLFDLGEVGVFFDIGSPIISCIGFDSPLDNGPVTVRGNRALPLKAELIDGDGVPITDLEINSAPVVQVMFTPEGASEAVDVSDDALPAGQGTEGNQFEFSNDRWRFNLKTKNYGAPGTYVISLVSGDPNEYRVTACEGQFVREP